MTENEAIEIIKKHCDGCEHNAGIECFAQGEEGICWEVKKIAILSMKEIQKYREIGTVKECRAAVEKQGAKKPKDRYKTTHIWDGAYCPVCGCGITARWSFCQNCGQAIDWSDSPMTYQIADQRNPYMGIDNKI